MQLRAAVPILRMHARAATRRSHLDRRGCTPDGQDGQPEGPVCLQVSRGSPVLHLSSHPDDGTPGSAVLLQARGLTELHAELQGRRYPCLEDGAGGGVDLRLIDPASNRLRFLERAA